MKKIHLFILISSFIILGCSSDSDNDSNTNTGTTTKIFDGDVTLNSQEDVDNFGSNQYNRITGSLIIIDTANDLTDLSMLSDLKTIDQDFKVANCNNLINLNGLGNITRLIGAIDISNNPILEHVELYISNYSASFNCSGNTALTSLNLPSLSEVDFYFNLTNLNEDATLNFQSLTTIGESFNFYGNFVSNLSGFNNLTHVTESVRINGNPNLLNIDALNNLNTNIQSIQIGGNDSLLNINGLGSLTDIEFDIVIEYNILLTDFCGLNSAIIDGEYDGYFLIRENGTNPTQQDILDGNCN